MNPIVPPKWGPRLARLYALDVRRLEALHAGRLSPGAKTWNAAVDALYARVHKLSPVKGAKLIGKAIDYLNSVARDERAHIVLSSERRSRSAVLAFITFNHGPHPDPAVRGEEGLNLTLHIISCARSRQYCVVGVPVAFISRHAMNRLYERGHDITEPGHATNVFTLVAVLGFLTHRSAVHRGLSLTFAGTLLVGGLHRHTSGIGEDCYLDIRTVLPVDEIGPSRQALLDQGKIAAFAVVEWLSDGTVDLDELAARIPVMPQREDTYPARMARDRQ